MSDPRKVLRRQGDEIKRAAGAVFDLFTAGEGEHMGILERLADDGEEDDETTDPDCLTVDGYTVEDE